MPPADPLNHEVSRHLLVVDDVEANRNVLRQMLERVGYRITTAKDGMDALEKIAHQVFDLILLDMRMPEMDGVEVLRAIRTNHSRLSLPVIMVSAESNSGRIVEALKSGANDYLVKPLQLQITLARIEAQLSLGRLAAIKDEVVRFASHDLKKPLLVMMDIAQSLKDELANDGALPDDGAELLDLLLQTGGNMQQVIAGFIDQADLQQGDGEVIRRYMDVNDSVLRSIHANGDYALRKGIELKTELAQDLPRVKANEFRLCQVLDNLIGNALKFSPRGTRTTVRTRAEDGGVVVEVCDNGPGLQDSDFDHLFEKHAKLSNRPTGKESSSGIGLAICKQLITLDEGVIGARNNDSAGATFWIRLPMAGNSQ
jgi:signal transduction histidine kinase